MFGSALAGLNVKEMLEDVLKQLAGYGLPGIAGVLAIYIIRTLYLRNNEVQDKRIDENREMLKGLHDASDAINNNTKAIATLTELIRMQHRGGGG